MWKKFFNWRGVFLVVLEGVAFYALFMFFLVPDVPGKVQEAIAPTPEPRYIYFKLPLKQTEYHWIFEERSALLAGTLTLRLHGAHGEEVITVFDNGILSDDWVELGCKADGSEDEIYFGFKSSREFMVANGDLVEMFLNVPAGVNGTGPHTKGILRAGEYRAINAVKVYSSDSGTAFLREKKWEPQWELELTQDTGWMEERAAQAKTPEAAR